jgi:hypothetical protein
MQTLGEFLKEYEASGGVYPVMVYFDTVCEYEVPCKPRLDRTPMYTPQGDIIIMRLNEERDWRLWTPPKKKVRKEKRYAWLNESAPTIGYGVFFTSTERFVGPLSGSERGYERAPWLDGEVEIEAP